MKRALKILAVVLIGWTAFETYRSRWLRSIEPDVIRSL